MGLFNTLKQGQAYLDSWLLHPKLGMIFAENRVIKATKFSQKFMPFIAVFAIVWQQILMKQSIMAFSAAVLTALFALCIPLQGLYWLGKRANKTLPVQSAVQFQKIFQRLQQTGIRLNPVESPTYQDLADLLKKAEKHLPADFWQEI